MAKQTISLCMMAKDEEKYLEQCLSSVKGLVDEIIIIDTGSKDKTKEIAKKFNAKVFDFKWNDDFSAARNESLKHATKDWVLVLDADENLGKESVAAVKKLVENKENDAYSFVQKNYTDSSSVAGFVAEEHKNTGKTYLGWYGSLITRLFRNKKDYRFSGMVHELVNPSIEAKKGKIAPAGIGINHYGNSDPDAVKKKMASYLELCKKKAEKAKDANSYYELGVLYKENNNFDEAVSALSKAIKSDQSHYMAHYELGVVYEKQKNHDKAVESYKSSLKIKENFPSLEGLGACYLKQGKLKDAYSNLIKALELNPNKHTIYNNLGAVFEKGGNYDAAIKILLVGISINPNNKIGYYNLAVAFEKKKDFAKAIKSYEKAAELGHSKKEEIEKRVNSLQKVLLDSPRYRFKVGS